MSEKQVCPKQLESCVCQNNNKLKDRSINSIIKNSSKNEKINLILSVVGAVTCVALIISLAINIKSNKENEDKTPLGWRISREKWGALPFHNSLTTEHFDPLQLVIVHGIQNTITPVCVSFEDCSKLLKHLQQEIMGLLNHDLPYNFAIGNDGRVYEARGWGAVAGESFDANPCAVVIGFVGDYRTGLQVTDEQSTRVKLILEEGVNSGYLKANFTIVTPRDLIEGINSNGCNLYNAIRLWKNYDHENWFRGKSCNQIHNF